MDDRFLEEREGVPDWFSEDHDEGTTKIYFQEREEGQFVVVARPVSFISVFFSPKPGFFLEKGWCVGLFEDAHEDESNTGYHHGYPIGEPPAKVPSTPLAFKTPFGAGHPLLRRKSTNDRSKSRAI